MINILMWEENFSLEAVKPLELVGMFGWESEELIYICPVTLEKSCLYSLSCLVSPSDYLLSLLCIIASFTIAL